VTNPHGAQCTEEVNMLNRLPPDSTKGIPEDIVREYNNLCWIGRASAELNKMRWSERVQALLDKLQALCNTPPREVQTQHDNCHAVLLSSDDSPIDDEKPIAHWYNRFVLPEDLVNWLSNLTVSDVIGFALYTSLAVVILITMVKFVHPN